MGKCQFVDPSNNYVCGKNYQIERIQFISPSEKQSFSYLICSNHSKLRFDVLNLSEKEIQSDFEKDRIKYQEKRDKMSDIWNSCRRCNLRFNKEDVTWAVDYFRIRNDIQISLKKSFRIHRECAMREMTLYGHGREIIKDTKLDVFS